MSVLLNVLTLSRSTIPTKHVSTSLELVNWGICYSFSGQTRECLIWDLQFVFECSIFQTHQSSRFHAEETNHSLQKEKRKKKKPERMRKINSKPKFVIIFAFFKLYFALSFQSIKLK